MIFVKAFLRVILPKHQRGLATTSLGFSLKFGRMIYFDDLIKDLWFVIGFSNIRCHGNQMSLFLIF